MKRRRRPDPADDTSHHPNSIYHKNPPDFQALAQQYPEFAKHVKFTQSGSAILDWNDPEALLALTKHLLRHDFNLSFDLPRNHLCPPVPQRLNYILWLEDLLGYLPRSREPIGIDIGTGASAIFALLGSSRSMKFVCTEIDADSVRSARNNIDSNNLQDKIEVIHVNDPSKILAGVISADRQFDFCVCNPPFFDSLDKTGLNNKRVCLATDSELVCDGGELQFIKQLLDESANVFKDRIGWYTTMLGRKVTLSKLLPLVHATNPTCVQTTTFKQGRQTRWGLAWTYKTEAAIELEKTKNDRKAELRCNFVAEQTSLQTIQLLVNEWARSKSGKISNKSPLLIVITLPIGDDGDSAGFKISLVPLQSNQIRIIIDVQSPQADRLQEQLQTILSELQSILS